MFLWEIGGRLKRGPTAGAGGESAGGGGAAGVGEQRGNRLFLLRRLHRGREPHTAAALSLMNVVVASAFL